MIMSVSPSARIFKESTYWPYYGFNNLPAKNYSLPSKYIKEGNYIEAHSEPYNIDQLFKTKNIVSFNLTALKNVASEG